jgi:hypothetical protein
LSGTINVTYDNAPVPKVTIQPRLFEGGPVGNMEHLNPGTNAPWLLYIPALATSTQVTLYVAGGPTNGYIGALFEFTDGATVNNVQNTDISGIAINLGNITP